MFYRVLTALATLLAAPLAIPAEPAARKPVIGINMNLSERTGDRNVTLTLRTTYIDAVHEAGGLPILLPALRTHEDIAHYVAMCDGFVFVGGPDINPARFGQEPHEKMNPINPRREEFDFALMAQVLESEKPLLAICLGMQMLNVIHGGDMIQDIPDLAPSEIDHRPEQPQDTHAHTVTIQPDTKLSEFLGGKTEIPVNSIHHQACGVLGRGIIASAHAPDGIVEAIELTDHPFALGIQWHPEIIADEADQKVLFKGLIDAVNRSKSAPLAH